MSLTVREIANAVRPIFAASILNVLHGAATGSTKRLWSIYVRWQAVRGVSDQNRLLHEMRLKAYTPDEEREKAIARKEVRAGWRMGEKRKKQENDQ